MPIYDYEYNGKIYSFESDVEPNEQEVLSLINSQQPQRQELKAEPAQKVINQHQTQMTPPVDTYQDDVNNFENKYGDLPPVPQIPQSDFQLKVEKNIVNPAQDLANNYNPQKIQYNPVYADAINNLNKRQEWEENHPIISSIQKNYQPMYRTQEDFWNMIKENPNGVDTETQLDFAKKLMAENSLVPANVGADYVLGRLGYPGLIASGAINGLTESLGDIIQGKDTVDNLWKKPLEYGAGSAVLGGIPYAAKIPVVKQGLDYAKEMVVPVGKQIISKAGEVVSPVIDTILNPINRKFREANIKARRSIPVYDRMTEEQLGKVSKPDIYNTISEADLNYATMPEQEMEALTQPMVNVKPSNWGIKDINTADNQVIANQFNQSINEARNIVNEFTDYSNYLKNKYGSIENLRKIVAEDIDEFGKPKSQFQAQIDLDNFLKMQDNLINNENKYLSQVGSIDKRYKQLDNAVEVPQDTTKYVQEIINPKPDDIIDNTIDIVPKTESNTTKGQILPETQTTGINGQQHMAKNSFGDERYAPEIRDALTETEHEVLTHKMQQEAWMSKTPEQQASDLADINNIKPDVLYGKSQAINQAIADGKELSTSMLNGLAKRGVEAGQEIEAYKWFIPTTPEGITLEITKNARKTAKPSAVKMIDNADNIAKGISEITGLSEVQKNKAIEKLLFKNGVKTNTKEVKSLIKDLSLLKDMDGLTGENVARLVEKRYKIPTVDVSDYPILQDLANKFSNAKTLEEQQFTKGLIDKFIKQKQQRGFWQTASAKEKSLAYMNMLGTVSGRLADLVATGAYQGVVAIDDAIAQTIGKATGSKAFGGYGSLNPVTWAKNVGKGAKRAWKETEAGISTPRTGEVDRYNLGYAPEFEGVPILGWGEKTIRHSVNDPDRAFYEGKNGSSLADLAKTLIPKEEWEQIAREEGLRNVYQNDYKITEMLNDGIKKFDDSTGAFRIGTRLSPFTRTMSNLISDAVERGTGASLLGGLLDLSKATTLAEERAAINRISRGITGFGLGTLGGGLALNQIPNNIGQINPEDTFGDDVTGLPPQSIVIGDNAISLANFPTLTIPAAIGKPLFNNDLTLTEKATQSLANAFGAVSSIPALRSMNDLVKNINDSSQDISKIIKDGNVTANELDSLKKMATTSLSPLVANSILQDIPLSGALGRVRTSIDPQNRDIRSDNLMQAVGNRIANRLPGLSSKLPEKTNVVGEKSMRTNLDNPARSVVYNLSPMAINKYKEPPYVKTELDNLAKYANKNNLEGKTKISLQNQPRKIKIGDLEPIVLDNAQYSKYSKIANKKVYAGIDQLMQTPLYKNSTPEKRIDLVLATKNKALEVAKIEVFGDIAKKQKKYTPAIVSKINSLQNKVQKQFIETITGVPEQIDIEDMINLEE